MLCVANRKQHTALESIVLSAGSARCGKEAYFDQVVNGNPARVGPSQQPVPFIGRKTEMELLNTFFGDSTLLQIFSGRRAGRIGRETAMECIFRPCGDFIETLFTRCCGSCAGEGFQLNASPLCEHRERFGEGYSLALHDKTEDIATDVADPALPTLTLGIDLQTWIRVVVPGTECLVGAPFPTEGEILSDQVDDIRRLSYLFFSI